MPIPFIVWGVIAGVGALAGAGAVGYGVHISIQQMNEAIRQSNANKYAYDLGKVFGTGASLAPFLLKQGRDISTTTESRTAVNYIRWDAFAHLLNTVWIPKNDKDNAPSFVMQTCQIVNEDLPVDGTNQGKHVSPLLYNRITSPLSKKIIAGGDSTGLLDMSLDSTVCLLPHQLRRPGAGFPEERLGFLWPPFIKEGFLPPKGNQNMAEEFTKMISIPLDPEEEDSYIGGIYLCVEKLASTYESMSKDDKGLENPDFVLYDYIKRIWDDVNAACANTHDFKLTVDHERPNVVRVIDMSFQTEKNLNPKDIVELNIQSNTSVMRDFSFNTSIPSSMTATIAVAAQNPDSTNNLEQSSFAALHKNIRNRFSTQTHDDKQPDQADITYMEANFNTLKENYIGGITALNLWSNTMLSQEGTTINESGEADMSEEIGKHKAIIRTVQDISSKLIKMSPVTDASKNIYKGQPIPKAAIQPRSAIIPLKFTGEMDGISGIVIGNVFKVPDSRLPRGYKEANVAFVAMGEEQKITSGQDWTTKITGQMVLLDDPTKHQDGGSDGWDANEFIEKLGVNYLVDENGNEIDQGISEEQKLIDPGMNDVMPGDKVYLKMTEDTNVRSSAEIDNEAGWYAAGDNNIGMLMGRSRNKGMYLGVVRDVKWADSVHNLEVVSGSYVHKTTGESVGEINTQVPWYDIEFDAKNEDFYKEFKLGYVRRGDGEIDANGADDWKLWFKVEKPVHLVRHKQDLKVNAILPDQVQESMRKYASTSSAPFIKGRGWMRIDVLQSKPVLEPIESTT